MKHSTVQALILSKKRFGDGHLMLSALTKEQGYLNISAFGGQRLSKRFAGKLDYFQVLEFEIQSSIKEGLVYHNLNSVNNVSSVFNNIPKDIKKYIAGSYVLELPNMLLTEHENYFDFVYDYLEHIDSLIDTKEINKILISYTLATYRKAGFICNNLDISDNKLALNELLNLHSKLINKVPKTHSMLASVFNDTVR